MSTAVTDRETLAPRGGRRRTTRAGARSEALAGYAFAAPTLLLLGVFVLLPLLGALWISLRHTGTGGADAFVGLDNYARLLRDGRFWRACFTTAAFTAVVTPASMAAGLGVALLLDTALPARGLLRSLVILPMAISGVATALMGVLLFDENSGVLVKMARAVGLPAIHWQSAPLAAFASVVLMTLWWRVGFNMLVYLAGLQGVGVELHEAARLDGAGPWQRLRHVTLPALRPQTFLLLVLDVIYAVGVFDIVFVMTGGGPQDATNVLVTYAYDNGFVVGDQGYAAALGVVLLLASLVFTALRWRTTRDQEDEL